MEEPWKLIARYHLHNDSSGRPNPRAARVTAIPKRITSHTSRHSFATHPIESGSDIGTVQSIPEASSEGGALSGRRPKSTLAKRGLKLCWRQMNEATNPPMKTRDFLYLLGCAAIPLPACAPDSSATRDPNARPLLRVGVSGDNAPLIYETGRRQFSGVEADFARMLGTEIGREVRFVPMRFERLITALQSGDIDIIMSGMTVIMERRTLVDFTDPYMVSGQALLVRNSRAGLFQDPRLIFISPFRIGVQQGTIGQAVALRAHPGSTVVPFATPDRAASALLSNRIDAVLHDAPVLWHITARNPTADYRVVPRLLTNENLAWAVRRGDSDLRGKANSALAKWRKNGMLDRTLRTHMPHYQILQRI